MNGFVGATCCTPGAGLPPAAPNGFAYATCCTPGAELPPAAPDLNKFDEVSLLPALFLFPKVNPDI